MSKKPITIGMAPAHPGLFLKEEVLQPLGLSISRAADVLKVRRATLSELVNGHSALSAEMALRFEMAFDVDTDMLLRMQSWYDVHTVRSRADDIGVSRYEPA